MDGRWMVDGWMVGEWILPNGQFEYKDDDITGPGLMTLALISSSVCQL